MTDGAKTQQGELVIYRAENGRFQLEAKLVGETVWLSMNQIADLFGVNVPAISKHVRNIYEVGELSRRVAAIAATNLGCASELTSLTPASPRATRPRM